MVLQDFVKKGLAVTNEMGEVRKTTNSSIIFPNGWVGSIVENGEGHSVAVCDYNGYFNWDVLKPFGTTEGIIVCKDEGEICKALTIIESLNNIV